MVVRKLMALLTVLALSALVGCTSTSDNAAPAAPGASSTTDATVPRTRATPDTVTTTSTLVVPAFGSRVERDTAFVAQLAAMTWASPQAGPGYPAKFRRSALAYESSVCRDARQAGSAARVTAPTEQLDEADRARLVGLSVAFYCPSLAGSANKPAVQRQKATCPRISDILVSSHMSPPMMSDNYFYSTVTYAIAFMNLTDYPVWIQPQVKWTASPIYKGGYPTGDGAWKHSWQVYSDPRAPETTPGRLLKPGEVWRVDAGQSGPYSWKSMSVRVDPTAFVPQGCGYQPA